MKRKLLSALGALALWAGQAKAQDSILPVVAFDDKAPAVLSGSCGADGCNHNYCCGRGGLYAGLALYFVQPNWETNPAGLIDTNDGLAFQQDFTYNIDVAPCFWIGWQNDCGYGARIRYWQYAQSSNVFSEVPGGVTVSSVTPLDLGVSVDGPGFAFAGSTLNVLTWDFELTKEWQCECWTILGAAGVRYAHLSQNYNAFASSATAGVRNNDEVGPFQVAPGESELASGHNFNGAGPTVALEAKRHLGNGGLALYANSRLALLYGTGKQNAFLLEFDEPLEEHHARQQDLIPFAELEVGIEANRNMGRFNLLMQSGVVGQVYFGAGNASNTEGAFTNGADNSSNLGFLGFTLRMGVGF